MIPFNFDNILALFISFFPVVLQGSIGSFLSLSEKLAVPSLFFIVSVTRHKWAKLH